MFVHSMSTLELAEEARKDLSEVHDRFRYTLSFGDAEQKRKRYFKSISPLQRRHRHFIHEDRIISSRNNDWLMSAHVFQKHCIWKGYCKVEQPSGYRLITHQDETTFIFNCHYFSRYRERCLDRAGVDAPHKTINIWYKRNGIFTQIPQFFGEAMTSEVHLLFADGIGIGLRDEDNMYVEVRTFLSFDELRKSQLDDIHRYMATFHETIIKGEKTRSRGEANYKRLIADLFCNTRKKTEKRMRQYAA